MKIVNSMEWKMRFIAFAPILSSSSSQRSVYKYAAASRACLSSRPRFGIAVPDSTDGGFSIQRTKLSGVFGSSPAIMVRRLKEFSGGPSSPLAAWIPGIVWHAPQPED